MSLDAISSGLESLSSLKLQLVNGLTLLSSEVVDDFRAVSESASTHHKKLQHFGRLISAPIPRELGEAVHQLDVALLNQMEVVGDSVLNGSERLVD